MNSQDLNPILKSLESLNKTLRDLEDKAVFPVVTHKIQFVPPDPIVDTYKPTPKGIQVLGYEFYFGVKKI